MGTNIYLKKTITNDHLASVKKKIRDGIESSGSLQDLKYFLHDAIEEIQGLDKDIHICKVSYGWQLLFAWNRDLYDCTWQAMTDYIRKSIESGEYVMKDEYGDAYSLDNLQEDFESHKSGYNYDTYVADLRRKGNSYIYESIEFISDGMRWTDAEFS